MKECKFGKRIWQGIKQNIATILLVVLLALLACSIPLFLNSLGEYKKQIEELQLQLTYLQDTTNVIQTNVNNMESNVKAVLDEEASILEDLDIELYSCHFAEGTYDVKVNVVPKSYTDTMKASIFFGTKEYSLYMDGFSYSAIITLPLDMSYEGNVTVLFTDGSRRSTEVRKEYTDVQSRFDKVLRGIIGKTPDYIDGNLSMDNAVYFHLKSNNRWDFIKLDLVVETDGEETYVQDLRGATPSYIPEDEEADDVGDDVASSELEENADSEVEQEQTVRDMDGQANVAYQGQVDPGTQVRVFLRATTKEDITFAFDLYNGYTALEGDGFAESPSEYKAHYTIYDDKGGTWYVY